MKLTKKILVAVLALALLASCFVSSVFATDTHDAPNFTAPGITKLDDILEYYACEDYIAENYENSTDEEYGDFSNYGLDDSDGNFLYALNERYFELYDCLMYLGMYNHETKVGVTANPTDESDKVLFMDLGVDDFGRYARSSSDGSAWTEKVFLTFDVYFDETCTSNSFLEVQVKLEGRALNSVLKFDFGYGDIYYNEENPDITGPVVWYAPWDAATGNFSTERTTIDGFSPKVNTWYSVTVCFNAEDEVCSFDIVEGSETVASVSYDIPGATGISAFECKGAFSRYETMFWEYMEDESNPIHALMYLDDVEIYEGSYKRTPSEKEKIAKDTLKEIETFYNSEACSTENKLLIADVFDELLGYDEESILGYVPAAWQYVNATFVNEIIARATAIDATSNYYDRVSYMEDKFAPIDAKVEYGITELLGVTAEMIEQLNAAREAAAAENAALEVIKTHSEGFIAAVNAYDPTNKDYDDIVAYYTEANSDDYKLRSPEYIGMAEATEIFDAIKYKYDRMTKDVEDFISYIEVLKASETFGAYFNAYKTASIAYYKYDEMPAFKDGAFINPDLDNTTNVALMEAVTYFEENEAATEAKIAECEAFNIAVLKATSSDYYPSFIALIEAADAAYEVIADEYDYVKDYKGITDGTTIADTVATLDALKAAKEEKLTATDLYIIAVNKIAEADGFYAKREAVKAAIALKAAGDNLAVEGVLEANLALTAAEAEVNELQGNSESVIALVAELEAAETISERRALIREINNYVDGVADDYQGVTAAIASFNTIIAQFEADVAAANAALESAMKNVISF